jgi:MFS family permease
MKVTKNKPGILTRFQVFRDSSKSTFSHLATGGEWAHSQSPETRRNLIAFWFDGFFASAGDNIVVTYLVVYLLALGATQEQIGLMSSLSSLTAAAVLLPGAWLVERIGRRRGIVLFGGSWARIALLLLALAPFVFQGSTLIIAGIIISISRDAMGNLAFPAWMSITGDIIPMEGRGRYFASRNFIMGITGITATFLIGLLIPRFSGTEGYQIALGISFLLGVMGVYSFSRIHDYPQPVVSARPQALENIDSASTRIGIKETLAELLTHHEFVQFAAVSALWNIALNIGGPFFSVYLVKNLGADATLVGLTTIASAVSGMLIQYKLGELNDRWGSRKLTVISGLLIPIMPFAWMFINSGWQVIPINILGGILWGAYGMGSFNYLLMVIPPERRARYSAIFQVAAMLSLAIGAALGSLIVTKWGFHAVFGGSGIGRLIAALLFAGLSMKKRPPRVMNNSF